MKNEELMIKAIELATRAGLANEVPVGAIIVNRNTGQIIAEAHNEVVVGANPVAHAEILAIQKACATLKTSRLDDYDLIVTLEPCAMCAMAMSHARMGRVIFGAYDPKSGGVEHGARVFTHTTTHHKPEVIGGVMEQACSDLLKQFFQQLR